MAKPLCNKIDETISDGGIHKINDDDDDDVWDVRLLIGMGLLHDELLSIAIRVALTIFAVSFAVVEEEEAAAAAFVTTTLPIPLSDSLLL